MIKQIKLQILLSFFGLLIAIYLYSVKVFNLEPLCGVSSCDIVNKSVYSYFLGVAVSIWGIMYYTIVIIMGFELFQSSGYKSTIVMFLWRKARRLHSIEKFVLYVFQHPGKLSQLLFGENIENRKSLRSSYTKRLIDTNIFVCSLGLLYSIYLTFLEAFVIKAFCQWCLVSAWITVCLFVLSIRVVKRKTY